MAARTASLESENRALKSALSRRVASRGIVGESLVLQHALGQLEQVAGTDASVLLVGESGTGKELFARALHLSSGRREGPYVRVNGGAIPETLFERELFGHEKGAFTGAAQLRVGRFEQAHRGTLFLDEVGDLAIQVKLLRVLQEQTVVRVGGSREIPVDVPARRRHHHRRGGAAGRLGLARQRSPAAQRDRAACAAGVGRTDPGRRRGGGAGHGTCRGGAGRGGLGRAAAMACRRAASRGNETRAAQRIGLTLRQLDDRIKVLGLRSR